jgi:NADH-quinone oxidoreductase subunit F
MTTALPVAATSLEEMAADYEKKSSAIQRRVVICAGTGCVASGSLKVHDALVQAIEQAGLSVVVDLHTESHDDSSLRVSKSGCQGFCQMGPLLSVEPDGLLYVKVQPQDVTEIVETTLKNGNAVERLLYVEPRSNTRCKGVSEIPFYSRQSRQVLQQCGQLDPEDIREYAHMGGYRAARKAYLEQTPEEICKEILDSGLRGRGGGGFPTGRKWQLTLAQPGPDKYVVCNGDEGDRARSWTAVSWKATRTA